MKAAMTMSSMMREILKLSTDLLTIRVARMARKKIVRTIITTTMKVTKVAIIQRDLDLVTTRATTTTAIITIRVTIKATNITEALPRTMIEIISIATDKVLIKILTLLLIYSLTDKTIIQKILNHTSSYIFFLNIFKSFFTLFFIFSKASLLSSSST